MSEFIRKVDQDTWKNIKKDEVVFLTWCVENHLDPSTVRAAAPDKHGWVVVTADRGYV